MNKKNGTITIGQLAKNPKAIELLNQYGKDLIHHPMAIVVKGWTVNQAIAFARKHGAREEQIQTVLRQLESI